MLPFTIIGTSYLIWTFYGNFAFFAYAGFAISLLLTKYFTGLTEEPFDKKNAFTDSRIKRTHELIESIRLIKMYAWEKPFLRVIEEIRENEILQLLKAMIRECVAESISYHSVYLWLSLLCMLYVNFGNGILSPNKVYTSLMIFSYIRIFCFYFFFWGV